MSKIIMGGGGKYRWARERTVDPVWNMRDETLKMKKKNREKAKTFTPRKKVTKTEEKTGREEVVCK